RWFDDLGQDASSGAWVQKGDAAVADAHPGLGVDQLQPGGGELLQGRVDVVDRVGDVVQPGAVLGQVFADRRVGAERRQQLDVALADVEQYRLDALGLHRLAVGELHLEAAFVE